MNNQQQGNRLQLNFGFGGGGGDRNQYNQDSSGRAFPTTPSTFPQPVYPNQAGQQEVWGAQQQNYGNGYFMGNPYQQAQYQGQQGNLQPGQQRFNDPTNGLVHQLSHQHLGGGGRSGSPYGRQPSPSQQRPRTAGERDHQQYGSYLGQQMPRQPSINDEEPPQKTPEKYSDNVLKQSKVSVNLVSTFFKDSVQRARDRNQR
jgi:protein-serine/threonine kinase